jgi:UDP-glucose 4-epimerase
MKILVTGGAGFIGSHLVDAYIIDGHQVSVIDNLSTGKMENVNPKAKFYKGDLADRKFVYQIVKKERPEIINHQAALASLRGAVQRPEELVDANITGTMNLLLAAGRWPIKKFIFASSCGLLGHPQKLPVDETAPANPLSPYAFSKWLNELMITFYASWYKFTYLLFRYPNVYGPRQDPLGEAGVIPIFAGLIKKNKRPHIFGDGSKTRDYLYIDDVAQAHLLALKKGTDIILHLGWGKSISDQKIFDEVQKALDSSLKPIYEPFRDWEAKQISLDARKAKKVLGWKPLISLNEGIKQTLLALKNF